MASKSKLTWTTKKIKLGDLTEWKKNPVRISDTQAKELAKSINRFDRILPYVAAAPLNGGAVPLLDGHQRKKVELSLRKVSPDVLVDVRVPSRILTEKERQEIAVRLRKNVGEFDFDKLMEFFPADDLLTWGFTEKELQIGGFEFEENKDDESQIDLDRFKEITKKWKTKNDQLWKVGNHLIYCGDSLETASIEKVLQGQEPSLVIADPPYGVNIVAANGYVGGGESQKGMIPFGGKKAERGSVGATHVVKAGKYPIIIGDENTETAKQAVALYLEKFNNIYHVWWGANYYIEAIKSSPCWLVWNKETTGNFADCELAWSNADISAKLFTHRWNGMLRDSERERRWHPTQKPAALAEWCYGLFTNERNIILDPFGGAGWSLLAAQRSNRKACIIEKSHEYVAVALERMATAFPELKITKIK